MSMRVPALAFLVLALLAPVPAVAADRAPSLAEVRSIRAQALKACGQDTCKFIGARVSTPNTRFAWADVATDGFSGVLLKRKPGTHRFRVVGWQGGGIGECSYWRDLAPARVLRDLKVFGLVGSTGQVRNCGRT
ncbi:hypothetical protein [Nocardioides sp. LHG3406-4]|uniref:hypothetical protein n=1 Tax=Nocardioides sp. LHG3406-4 TaxID=2804575 RepID=UPI003CF577C8